MNRYVALNDRSLPPLEDRLRTLRDKPLRRTRHEEEAQYYVPDDGLGAAIDAALTLSAPLLLTGEPGTGKTQVAYYVARYFGLDVHPLHVSSVTTRRDLFYTFDAVAYFHDAQTSAATLDKETYVTRGPLWRAYDGGVASVVLIDEIDKAPRDFPNDLLHVLDQREFEVPELPINDPVTKKRGPRIVRPRAEAPDPIVVITSNGERQLPAAFLRRCVVHAIELTPALIEKAIASHKSRFARLKPELEKLALDRFQELRRRSLRKPPATGELLMWLMLLALDPALDAQAFASLSKLPHLGVLVKDEDDRATL